MKDRILSIGSGILTGTTAFVGNPTNSGILIEIGIALCVAFATGMLAYFGNEAGRLIKKKIKAKLVKNEN